MASKRSSVNEGREIKSLPVLGKSWYKRGASYWLRRSLMTLGFVFVLAILATMTGGLVNGIATADMPLWVRVILLAIAAAAIVRSIFKAWSAFNVANRQARKQGVVMTMAEAAGEPRRSARERQRRAVAGGTTLGAIATLGGGLLLAVSVLFNVGWGIVVVIASCQKYFSPEEFGEWQKINREHAA